MPSSINAILPTLILVCMGIALRRTFRFEKGFWDGLEKIVYFVFFPILLFDTTIRASLSTKHAWVLALASGIMFLGIVLSYLGTRWFQAPPKTRHSIFQCGFRFNTYVGIAVISSGFGKEAVGLFALMAGINIPIANIAAISALSSHSGANVFRELSKNPLVIGTLAGLLGNIVGLQIPPFIDQTMTLISHTAIVLGLIAVGSALVLVKVVALSFSALPTASSAYILATRMNGDGKTVALQITLGSIIAMITIPIWLTLAERFLSH